MNTFSQPQQLIIKNNQIHSPDNLSADIVGENNRITITPKQNSRINLYVINDTDESIQQTIDVYFYEPHANVAILGLYQGKNKQSFEIATTMHHFVGYCTSTQLWKGVLRDSAQAIFTGKIIVSPFAQKTIAHLSNKNLLLSKTAEVKTRPFLEINANDVRCTHGATVGCLDQDALFYLRSRGFLENDAKELLIEAFANEITEAII